MNASEKETSLDIEDAIESGDLDAVRRLITTSPDRLSWIIPFGTWLHWGVICGQLEIIKFLVEQGIDIDRRAGFADNSALCLAADKGYVEIVRFLLDRGAELDVSSAVRNPLFGAVIGKSAECVRLLLEAGINAHVRYTGQRMKNMDAAAFAEERGEKEIAALIRDFLAKHPEETQRR